jgi:hypothetical protein
MPEECQEEEGVGEMIRAAIENNQRQRKEEERRKRVRTGELQVNELRLLYQLMGAHFNGGDPTGVKTSRDYNTPIQVGARKRSIDHRYQHRNTKCKRVKLSTDQHQNKSNTVLGAAIAH